MTKSVVEWLEKPTAGKGLFFADESDEWKFCSYSEIAEGASRVAFGLRDLGVHAGDIVAAALPTGVDFVHTAFGCWVAGASFCPIVPPGPFDDENDYSRRVAKLLSVVCPSAIVTDAATLRLVRSSIRAARIAPAVLEPGDCSGSINRQGETEIALIQFTSGSTGNPRGVCVTFDNLNANIEMISSWVNWGIDDATSSWLPLFHDMGLIGCMFASAANQTDLYVMRPDQFVRNPARWLRCFDAGLATLTAAPSFAFAYLARKVPPEALSGVDFSCWKTAVVGAEPIDGAALQAFARVMAQFGFSPTTFRTAYGLAEGTLAATGLPLGVAPRAVSVPVATVRLGEDVELGELTTLEVDGAEIASESLVSCGAPFPGVRLEILDADGNPVPDGCVGQISISGALVAAGYRGDREGGATEFEGGELLTGDAGLKHSGELFVLGRIGESVKVRGRNVFVEDVESRVASGTDLMLGQFAIIASPEPSGQSVVLLSERPEGDWADATYDILRREFGDLVSVRILSCAKGTIKRTSSGKPRRREMWELVVSGRLSGADVDHSTPDSRGRSEARVPRR